MVTLPAFLAGLLCWTWGWFLLLLLPAVFLARRHLLLATLLFAAGLLRGAFGPSLPDRLPPGEYVLTGIVCETPTLAGRWQRFTVATEDRRVLVYASPSPVIAAGDAVKVQGRLAGLVTYSDSPYMIAGHYLRRGILERVDAVREGAVAVVAPGTGLAAIGSHWRTATYERLRKHLGRRQAGIAMGIIAGQQSLVDEDVTKSMQRTGTLHLLSTSGLNVFFVAGFLMLLLAHLPIPKSVQVGIAIVLLVIYCAAVGWRAPVVRATVMASIFMAMYVLGRTPDALSVLAGAAIVLLFADPAMVFDAGFQLSFATVATLLLFGPNSFRWLRSRTARIASPSWRLIAFWVGASVMTTALATLGSAPLTAAHFGIVSVISPLANLLTAPVVPLIYLGCFLAELTAPMWEVLSCGLDIMFTGSFSAWIDLVNGELAKPAWAAVEFRPLDGAWWAGVVAFYAVLVAISRPHSIPASELDEGVVVG